MCYTHIFPCKLFLCPTHINNIKFPFLRLIRCVFRTLYSERENISHQHNQYMHICTCTCTCIYNVHVHVYTMYMYLVECDCDLHDLLLRPDDHTPCLVVWGCLPWTRLHRHIQCIYMYVYIFSQTYICTLYTKCRMYIVHTCTCNTCTCMYM